MITQSHERVRFKFDGGTVDIDTTKISEILQMDGEGCCSVLMSNGSQYEVLNSGFLCDLSNGRREFDIFVED